MSIANDLSHLLRDGVCRMGEIHIQTDVDGSPIALCHWQDAPLIGTHAAAGLTRHQGPGEARALATYAADGPYRFNKGQTNLPRGWLMMLENAEQLRQALDYFYPAGVGMFLAYQNGRLETQNLRDKLERQSGMYRAARTISNAGAQGLVRDLCGPAHCCAKRILWQLDAHTPLHDSEAKRFTGIPAGLPETAAIPLLCREACLHFVSECRRVAKDEAPSP